MKTRLLAASLLASAMLGGGIPLAASAQTTNTPRIDREQWEARQRIEEGIASGRINRDEARELFERERELRMREERYKADGRVTPEERMRLRRDIAEFREDVERRIASPGPGVREDRELMAMFSDIGTRINTAAQDRDLRRFEAERFQRRLSELERRRVSLTGPRGFMRPRDRDMIFVGLRDLRRDVERAVRDRRGSGRGDYGR